MSLTCGNTFAMAPSTTQVTHNTLITISSSLDAHLARALRVPCKVLSNFEPLLRTCLSAFGRFGTSRVLRSFRRFLSSNVFCPRLTLAAAIVQRVCITSYLQRVTYNEFHKTLINSSARAVQASRVVFTTLTGLRDRHGAATAPVNLKTCRIGKTSTRHERCGHLSRFGPFWSLTRTTRLMSRTFVAYTVCASRCRDPLSLTLSS